MPFGKNSVAPGDLKARSDRPTDAHLRAQRVRFAAWQQHIIVHLCCSFQRLEAKGKDSQSKMDDLANLEPGEGGVITRDGEEIAVWKDDAGLLHAVSASCTHQGCTVTWNNADRTWD